MLTNLAGALATRNPWAHTIPADVDRVVLLGMGSSAYAGGVAAARLRARGICAVSEIASSELLPRWGPGTLVVATSATGGSVETLDALERFDGSSHTRGADQHTRVRHHHALQGNRRVAGRTRGGRRGLP